MTRIQRRSPTLSEKAAISKRDMRWFASWHGRVGMVTAFFVLILAISGILIHHSHWLGLDAKPVFNQQILSFYGVRLPPVKGVQLGSSWLSWQQPDLFLNDTQISTCTGEFVGAMTLPDFWVVACAEDLLLFNDKEELIERLSSGTGIHFPIEKLGACEAMLCYQSHNGVWQLNPESLVNTKFARQQAHAIQWSHPMAPPENIVAVLHEKKHGGDITWERVLLDIHAGRMMGQWGPWILDGIALLFVALALSGFYLWSRR